MIMKLFDSIKRTEIGPAKNSEPHFNYINKTNRIHFQNVRKTLEEWFDEYIKYNSRSANDLRSRFRSSDNEHHLASLTELYLHHLLLINGYTPEAHPETPGISTKPEYIARAGDGSQFVIEAALIYENNTISQKDKFEANIYDTVNAVNSPDYLVSVDIEIRDSHAQPKLGK